jgi:hypothetical protein
MPRIRWDLPKHVYPIRDRYGNERYCVRRRHHKNVPMPGPETGPQLTRHDLPKIMAKIYYALRHQIEDALAAGTMPENEIREWIFPSAI